MSVLLLVLPFSAQIRTAKVTNLSLGATEQDIKEFFSFSGEIEYVDMHSENERSQTAHVTFKDPQGAETAVLLSATENKNPGASESAIQKAEDVVTGMLAKGFILGKDALNKAKTFDDQHQLTSTASAKVASLDQKIGLTAEQTVSTAGSAIMKNRYVLTGTSWVTGAFSRVSKAAEDVGKKTKEKVAEEEQGRYSAQGYSQVHD
ncbi:hypothetical protein C3L33_03469, partial [Rhododendron williamsianum]